MNDLIIIGAGGFGKEALMIAQEMNKIKKQWNILGFLDSGLEIGTDVFRGYKVIGNEKDWQLQNCQRFVIGISKPRTKEKIYILLKEKGAKFATLIHPITHVPEETIIGEGSIIGTAWLGLDVKLGKCVHIAGSMVGESTIDDFCTTTGFANIAGATLGKRVFVGSHAVVLNGKKIGDDAVVGAGSIVFSNVKPGTTVLGNPAKKIEL